LPLLYDTSLPLAYLCGAAQRIKLLAADILDWIRVRHQSTQVNHLLASFRSQVIGPSFFAVRRLFSFSSLRLFAERHARVLLPMNPSELVDPSTELIPWDTVKKELQYGLSSCILQVTFRF
jgi:hypothetical protein